jgi:hypothetical protein
MPRPRIEIDESKLFEACKEGVTVTRLLGVLGNVIDRETLRKRIQEYVASGKLVWSEPCRRGHAGILKTI